MEVDPVLLARFVSLDWLSRCDVAHPDEFMFPVKRMMSAADAIASAESDAWADAKVEAQGDLTGYLAKHHSDSYAGHWNRLMKAAHGKIETQVMPKVKDALERLDAGVLCGTVLLDLCRISLWATYSKRFRRLPDFFHRLLTVYERGHLPCGWDGDLDSWPEGQLIVY